MKDKPKSIRGISVSLKGALPKIEDVAFIEMPKFLIEVDRIGPFLRVITEKGHYRIRLEKEYRMQRQHGK
jgi:hypothetical protein